jgi:hypothetical protein
LSRELDAEVAEKVMGWTPPVHEIVDRDGKPMYRNREPYDHACRGECYWTNHSLAGTDRAPWRPRGNPDPPPYSTDMATAWTIVEHLHATGGWFFGLGINIHAERWCHFWRGEEDMERYCYPEDHYATAETEPLAICRAALKALAATTGAADQGTED